MEKNVEGPMGDRKEGKVGQESVNNSNMKIAGVYEDVTGDRIF